MGSKIYSITTDYYANIDKCYRIHSPIRCQLIDSKIDKILNERKNFFRKKKTFKAQKNCIKSEFDYLEKVSSFKAFRKASNIV